MGEIVINFEENIPVMMDEICLYIHTDSDWQLIQAFVGSIEANGQLSRDILQRPAFICISNIQKTIF